MVLDNKKKEKRKFLFKSPLINTWTVFLQASQIFCSKLILNHPFSPSAPPLFFQSQGCISQLDKYCCRTVAIHDRAPGQRWVRWAGFKSQNALCMQHALLGDITSPCCRRRPSIKVISHGDSSWKYLSTGHLYTGTGSPLNEFTSLFWLASESRGRNLHCYYLLTDFGITKAGTSNFALTYYIY